MSRLVFYEKPGCLGNARQRALLEAAGHSLDRRNLLTTPWTRASLGAFLEPLPVREWFNRSAPQIKSGRLNPDALDSDAALSHLIAEPILIRRPLMEREDGARLVGFDTEAVAAFVGLGPRDDGAGPLAPSLEGCAAIREVP